MTLQALRLPKKVDPSPARREQDQTEAVYGETGEYAMNDDLTEVLSLALFSGGSAITAVV